jgi:hypothetical protein
MKVEIVYALNSLSLSRTILYYECYFFSFF